MGRYRKKPVVIEARQFIGTEVQRHEVYLWAENEGAKVGIDPTDGAFFINTLEGPMRVSVTDYVIKGTHGEFYPCKADIFEANYEPVGL